MAADYITLTELANSLSIGSGETYADADMTAAITAASREVDRRCGRKFWSDSQTRYYTPTHPRILWIDDIKSAVTVEVDTNGDGSWETLLVQDTDYVLEPLNAAAEGFPWTTITLRHKSSAIFPLTEASVRVGGQFGWTEVPAAVKQAPSILASRFLKRVREAPFGVAGFGIDGGAVRVSNFDPDVDALLSAYVRVNHAL
jgi:hypothetical protein